MSTPKKVLIVDDEQELAVLLGFLLTHNNFETDLAYDGEEALVKLKSTHFDYVISDVRMPKMNGAELYKQSRIQVDNPPKFIFISGFEDILDKEAKDMGVLAIFSKPVSHEDIVARLREEEKK